MLTLSQPLEIWGQRGARVRAARAEAQAANLRGAQSRSDVASQLAVVYAQAESALRRYTLAEEALSLTRDDANAVNAIEDDFGNWILADDQVLDLERMGYVVSEEAGSKTVWRPFAEVWEAWLDQAPPVRIITWRVPAELVDEVEAFMAERGIERVGASDVDAPKDAPDGP